MPSSQEADKILVVKPVPSRPCSNFIADYSSITGEASQLISSAAQTPVAVRPKPVRLKPPWSRHPMELASPDDVSDADICSSSHKLEPTSSIVYKPVAKSVSRNVASFMGKYENSRQKSLSVLPIHVKDTAKTALTYQTPLTSGIRQETLMNLDTLLADPSNSFPVIANNHIMAQHLPPAPDRLSYDGYNWRKYGQKQVKGSEYPRSYYKCTHPNCQVKKKVERALDGKIAEIVYNGEHNHPKPLPPKRSQGKEIASDGNGRPNAELSTAVFSRDQTETVDHNMETSNEAGIISIASVSSDNLLVPQPSGVGRLPRTSSITRGANTPYRSRVGDGDYDDHYCKRRKVTEYTGTESIATQCSEPNVLLQIPTDSDVSGDGFHWRKYGQKVVKGNPYPRSYYKCTHLQCNVRKHVERSSDDPRSVITTYEGKHNHHMPDRNTSSDASEPQFPYPTENSK